MRISDWSSDVCSSDLVEYPVAGADVGLQLEFLDVLQQRAADAVHDAFRHPGRARREHDVERVVERHPGEAQGRRRGVAEIAGPEGGAGDRRAVGQIGRASCRVSVCQYLEIMWFAVSLKQKTTEAT